MRRQRKYALYLLYLFLVYDAWHLTMALAVLISYIYRLFPSVYGRIDYETKLSDLANLGKVLSPKHCLIRYLNSACGGDGSLWINILCVLIYAYSELDWLTHSYFPWSYSIIYTIKYHSAELKTYLNTWDSWHLGILLLYTLLSTFMYEASLTEFNFVGYFYVYPCPLSCCSKFTIVCALSGNSWNSSTLPIVRSAGLKGSQRKLSVILLSSFPTGPPTIVKKNLSFILFRIIIYSVWVEKCTDVYSFCEIF